jgi:hypothetical protein
METTNKNPKKGFFSKVIIGIITVILIVLMFPKGESIEFEVSEGAIWLNDELIAPFSFPIKKSEEIYKAELLQAKEKVFPVFLSIPENSQMSLDSLRNYSTYLIRTIDQFVNLDSVPVANPTFLSTSTYSVFENLRIQERNFIQLRGPQLRDLFLSAGVALDNVYKRGVLSIDSGKMLKDSIALRTGNFDRIGN